MKGDFTRLTFKSKKHYNRVLMQQGRVQLDSDWNEQLDITVHRVESEAVDTLGDCAAPMHGAAFDIVTDPNILPVEEQTRLDDLDLLPLDPGDFILTPGRLYVDGILCENEHAVLFTGQPDLPGVEPITPGDYLAYLDVWERHITFLEDPPLREVALGGPDTTTRAQTIWQVKLLPVDEADLNCLSELEAWNEVIAPSTGKLSARAQPEATSTDPCIVPPSAGFRGLQNQLYRVEIHDSGELNDATFKWSRDNGSLVFAITEFIDGMPTDRFRLRRLGRDKTLALSVGDWVEVLDDDLELTRKPGTLAQITDIDSDDLIITLDQNISELDLNHHPKVRRWDSVGLLNMEAPGGNDGFIPLEDGVEVKFEPGFYHSSDYWLIPARTILGNPELTQTGGIEWPMEGTDPLPQPPLGIQHHYCRLALLNFGEETLTVNEDCRPQFPTMTELHHLFYISGDGQEAMPGETLPKPLQAGVSNGQWSIEGAEVHFHITMGSGSLQSGTETGTDIIVSSNENGVATVTWQLDETTYSQQVEATLLDAAGDLVHLPIRFNANLSVAEQVAYSSEDCANLSESKTVQEAIDQICANAALYYVSGDGQSGMPGQQLPQPLEVRLANGHWPVEGEGVIFKVVPPGVGMLENDGNTGNEIKVVTDANGFAACRWTLDGKNPNQRVEASWSQRPDLPVHFNATCEPGIHIKAVLLGEQENKDVPLANDTRIPVDALASGIRVICDKAVGQLLKQHKALTVLNNPVCLVTLDLPYPLTSADVGFWDLGEFGYQTITLAAQVYSENEVILWNPNDSTIEWLVFGLDHFLKKMEENGQGDVLLARLILKGNFIWADEDQDLVLDGDVFGREREKTAPGLPVRTTINYPSGDGRRGGDFETWFWLSSSGEKIGSININSASAKELTEIPGIGNALANAIIENRPFNEVDELTRVSGISSSLLKSIRARITT